MHKAFTERKGKPKEVGLKCHKQKDINCEEVIRQRKGFGRPGAEEHEKVTKRYLMQR